MVLNWIWVAFFIIAFVIALVKLVFLGDFEVFPAMMDSTFSSSKTAFEISLGLTGVLSLWLGIMKIGEKGGVVNILAKMLSPLFSKLFPEIPKGHPVTGSIFMNIAANMLGLDNAATPLGLKAMEQMEEVKSEKRGWRDQRERISGFEGDGLESDDYVPRAEHQRSDANTYFYYGISRPDGSSSAYGYLHPHPVGHILFNLSRRHYHKPLSED